MAYWTLIPLLRFRSIQDINHWFSIQFSLFIERKWMWIISLRQSWLLATFGTFALTSHCRICLSKLPQFTAVLWSHPHRLLIGFMCRALPYAIPSLVWHPCRCVFFCLHALTLSVWALFFHWYWHWYCSYSNWYWTTPLENKPNSKVLRSSEEKPYYSHPKNASRYFQTQNNFQIGEKSRGRKGGTIGGIWWG